MSANGSAIPTESTDIQDKGKGKSVEEPSRTVDLEEEDEEEESGAEEAPEDDDDDDDEDMDEIDPDNIVGSRTRNKDINWAEANEKLKAEGEDVDDEDEDEDDDFEDPDDEDAMRD